MDGYARTNRNLKRVVLSLLSAVLVTVLILSSVFAKYTAGGGKTVKTRPAVFDIVFDSEEDPIIKANFSLDGDPGVTLGRTTLKKYHNFKVVTEQNEVRTECGLSISFKDGFSDNMIVPTVDNANFTSTFADGLWYSYRVYRVVNKGESNESVEEITFNGTPTQTNWTGYSVILEPHETIDFRLEMIIYNTDLDYEPNDKELAYYTDAITITASGTQLIG